MVIKGTWITSNLKYGIANIYAPNDPSRRRLFWSNLKNIIRADDTMRWVLFGDFNEVRSEEERLGSSFNPNTTYHFNKFISKSGLIDVQLGGRRFTYMSVDDSKNGKLDRFLVSNNTASDWPDMKVTTLPKLHLDHCHLLLSNNVIDFGPSSFRFFNSWLLDVGLQDVVKAWWVCNFEYIYFTSISPLSMVAGN